MIRQPSSDRFGIPKGRTAPAEEMFEAVNRPHATFTPMKIEIKYKDSCLGATGGSGRVQSQAIALGAHTNYFWELLRVTVPVNAGATQGYLRI
jgi:hypothetical protein